MAPLQGNLKSLLPSGTALCSCPRGPALLHRRARPGSCGSSAHLLAIDQAVRQADETQGLGRGSELGLLS